MNIKKVLAYVLSATIVNTAAGSFDVPEVADAAVVLQYGALHYCVYTDYIEINSCALGVEYIEIPSEIDGLPVTHIGKSAFQYVETVKGVSIPDSVTCIDDQAFYGSGITSITIPASVTKIGECAFAACDDLSSISVSAGVTEMGVGAFAYNSVLVSIDLTEGLDKIPDNAFNSCSSLNVILIPSSVTSIGESAFSGTALETVYYAGSEEEWGTVSIGDFNAELSNAELVFRSVPAAEIPVLGNLNGDDKVDASDAAMILTAAAAVGAGSASGLTAEQEENGDIDKGGSFNAADAAVILDYAAYTGSGGTKTLSQYLRGK